jgi:hypothetical protein
LVHILLLAPATLRVHLCGANDLIPPQHPTSQRTPREKPRAITDPVASVS